MRRAIVPVVALVSLGLGAGDALAATGPTFTAITDTPVTPVTAPGVYSAFFTLSGGDQGGEIRFTARGTQVAQSLAAYSGGTGFGAMSTIGQVDSLSVTGMQVLDGPAVEVGVAHTAEAVGSWCARGGVDAPYNEDVALSAPAGSTSTVLFTATLAPAFAGQFAAVQLVGDPTLTAPGPVLATGTSYTPTSVVDGVSLSVSKPKRGTAVATGTLLSGRSGVKVQLVGPTSPGLAWSLAKTSAALGPLGASLSRYGTATTTAGGKFTTTIKVSKKATILARTAASGTLGAGASCPVIVR